MIILALEASTSKSRAGYPGLKGVDFTRPMKHGIAILMKQKMMATRRSDQGIDSKEARRRFELPYDRDVRAELNCETGSRVRATRSTRSRIPRAATTTVSGPSP